jgi:hypothetical protein
MCSQWAGLSARNMPCLVKSQYRAQSKSSLMMCRFGVRKPIQLANDLSWGTWPLKALSVLPVKCRKVMPPAPASLGFHDGEQWHTYKAMANGLCLVKTSVKLSYGPTGCRKVLWSKVSSLMHCHFHSPTLWFSILKCEDDLLSSFTRMDLNVCSGLKSPQCQPLNGD